VLCLYCSRPVPQCDAEVPPWTKAGFCSEDCEAQETMARFSASDTLYMDGGAYVPPDCDYR